MNEYVRNNKYFKSVKEFRRSIKAFFNHTWNTIANTMVDRINDNFQILEKSTV